MSERHLHQDMTEAERRLSNVVMLGQVAELDAERARVRVQAGPILTAWLPFATVRAGPDRTWHAPEAGEQVVLVAPGGDLNQAVVVGSLYRDAYPPPSDSADISRTEWQDGAALVSWSNNLGQLDRGPLAPLNTDTHDRKETPPSF